MEVDCNLAAVAAHHKLGPLTAVLLPVDLHIVLGAGAHWYVGVHQIEEFEAHLHVPVVGHLDIPCAVDVGRVVAWMSRTTGSLVYTPGLFL